MKLNIIYEGQRYQITLDFDYTFTLSGLIPYITNIIGNGKAEQMIILDSNGEILSPNCKIIELMIINPAQYKTLSLKTGESFRMDKIEPKVKDYNFSLPRKVKEERFYEEKDVEMKAMKNNINNFHNDRRDDKYFDKNKFLQKYDIDYFKENEVDDNYVKKYNEKPIYKYNTINNSSLNANVNSNYIYNPYKEIDILKYNKLSHSPLNLKLKDKFNEDNFKEDNFNEDNFKENNFKENNFNEDNLKKFKFQSEKRIYRDANKVNKSMSNFKQEDRSREEEIQSIRDRYQKSLKSNLNTYLNRKDPKSKSRDNRDTRDYSIRASSMNKTHRSYYEDQSPATGFSK